MARIFISYRRADSADTAGRLYDHLSATAGNDQIFKDIHSIEYGEAFADKILSTIQQCDIVIVMIGPDWTTVTDVNGEKRLFQEKDYVRMEIREALRLKKRVVPLLVQHAKMPTLKELPEDLHGLRKRNAAQLRPDPDFHVDLERLKVQLGIKKRSFNKPRALIYGGAILGLLCVLVYLFLGFDAEDPVEVNPKPKVDTPSTVIVPIGERDSILYEVEIQNGVHLITFDSTIPYDPRFLGGAHVVDLPSLNADLQRYAYNNGVPVDYLHYSLVMHQNKATAIYTASNVDRRYPVRLRRADIRWGVDTRIPRALQRDDQAYERSDVDRGHLVTRAEISWGEVADKYATSVEQAANIFPNTNLQYNVFNRGLWLKLERAILTELEYDAEKMCVFSGPIYAKNPPIINSTAVPAAYWKVAVTVDTTVNNFLKVYAFKINHSDKKHSEALQAFELSKYQVSLRSIERQTGLDFGYLRNYDTYITPDLSRHLELYIDTSQILERLNSGSYVY